MQLVSPITRPFSDPSVDGTLELARRALSTVAPLERTVVVALPAPPSGVEVLLESFANDAAALWLPPSGPAFAAIGQAHVVRAEGPQRMRRTRSRAAEIWKDVVVVGPPDQLIPQPRFFGGCAFHPQSAAAPPWEHFGDSYFFLPELCYVRDQQRSWLLLTVTPEHGQSEADRTIRLKRLEIALRALHALDRRPESVSLVANHLEVVQEVAPEAWRDQIEHIRSLIAAGQALKIVAARRTTLRLTAPTHALRTLTSAALADAISTRFAQRIGALTFLGATPECIVAKRGRRVRADALAGSSVPTAAAELELVRGLKERSEHEIVVSEILRRLGSSCERLSYPAEPTVRRLRYVQHLHTPIAGTLGTPVHVLQLLERLHPTPAVAGTPTQTALEWINAHEASPRGWYAGPIGWFDRNGNGEFVVALRSALLTPDAAYVYAGAGIVAASDPYKEYQETELKMKTMLDALTQTLSAGTRR